MMDEVIPELRASRDFRVKYPEDLIQDGLAGQLWFGAEVSQMSTDCLLLAHQNFIELHHS